MFVLTKHVFGKRKGLKTGTQAFLADNYKDLLTKKKTIIKEYTEQYDELSIHNTLFHSVLHDENKKDIVIEMEVIKITENLSETASA